jgi:hypothetical protein
MGASHIAANHLAADRRACKLGTDGNSERHPANSSTFAVAFTRSVDVRAICRPDDFRAHLDSDPCPDGRPAEQHAIFSTDYPRAYSSSIPGANTT